MSTPILPFFALIPTNAGATINGAAWSGYVNLNQIVAVENVNDTATITMNGGMVITVPFTWIQANWRSLAINYLFG